jgi:hypothetical protein
MQVRKVSLCQCFVGEGGGGGQTCNNSLLEVNICLKEYAFEICYQEILFIYI